MSLHDIWRGDVMPLSGIAVAIGRNSFDPPAPAVPVFDVHHRTNVLHDSGSPAFSGITSYHSEKLHALLIPSNSGAQNIVSAMFIRAVPSMDFAIGIGDSTINLGGEEINSHPDVFVLATNTIQVNMSGVYEFKAQITHINSSLTARFSRRGWVERQAPGGSFAEIPGTTFWVTTRSTGTGVGGGGLFESETNGARFIMIGIAAGDKFRMRISGQSGGTPVPGEAYNEDGTSLTIKRIG